MKKNVLITPKQKVFTLAFWLLAWTAQAQEIAIHRQNVVPPPTYSAQAVKQQSLKSALQQMEEHYGVRFSYAVRLIDDKYVPLETDTREVLEKSLQKLLFPLGLKYEKLSEELIFITPNEKNTEKIERQRVESDFQESASTYLQSTARLNEVAARQMDRSALEKTITGTVTDLSTDESLPGVNVVVKNTTVGTVTDIDGNYRLTATDDAKTLVFSSVGYVKEEVTIGNQTVINLSMSPDIQSLSEVVVVGYGRGEEKGPDRFGFLH